jgi:hypothetical protein
MSEPLVTYDVNAFNTAAASENKIHDDSVARRFGFRAGLVPGVEVYAYMAHMPVARWGRAWLERGAADCRFLKPVYDGALARVTATEQSDGLVLHVESSGERCATGQATLPADNRTAPAADSLPTRTPPAERPPACDASLAPNRALGIAPFTVDRAKLSTYLDEIREIDPIYRTQGLVHPGQILRLANQALLQNVVLGPWIHVGSRIRHHATAHNWSAVDAAREDYFQRLILQRSRHRRVRRDRHCGRNENRGQSHPQRHLAATTSVRSGLTAIPRLLPSRIFACNSSSTSWCSRRSTR